MAEQTTIAAILVDEDSLTLHELARACRVDPNWVVERVETGLLGGRIVAQRTQWRFSSAELLRARCLISMESDMEANPELAALVADLVEEVRRLRRRLQAVGVED